MTEGDFYPGDLLKSVLMLPAEEWKKYEPLHARVKNIVKALDEIPLVIKEEINYFSGVDA